MKAGRILIPILPLIVSIAFFLIADIDSPRGGTIHLHPQNLISVAESFSAHSLDCYPGVMKDDGMRHRRDDDFLDC